MRLYRLPFFLILCLGILPPAHAHAPDESSLSLTLDEGDLLAEVSLTLTAAAALLPEGDTSPLNFTTLDAHRPALLAAAARVCTLLDPAGAPLQPERVLISPRGDHEIRISFIYPGTIAPSAIRAAYLTTAPGEAFCLVSDLRRPVPLRTVLTPRAPECPLPALVP